MCMLLNRLFSDTIYQLMWDTKRVKIYWCVFVVPRPRRGPALDTNMYKGWTQKVGYMYYDLSFQKWAQKMKQNAITMNNNNESKYIQVKACI